MTARLLTDDDAEHVWGLSQLGFGWTGEVERTLRGQTVVGVDGPAGLDGIARLRSYEQWWGGRAVPMGGIASVTVHPHARGRGTARAMLRATLDVMRERAQPVSVLFPTAPGIYRALGWEVVGTLDDTTVPTGLLRGATATSDVVVRTATASDVPAIAALYVRRGRSTDGLLTREGPEFPTGAEGVLEHDVVALATDPDGRPVGYASYGRGSGYVGSQLRLWELLAERPDAAAALVATLGSWDAVATTVLWRGPTTDLAVLLPAQVPPPTQAQPWMLRLVDAPAAVAARGWRAEGTGAFVLEDPEVPAHARGWRLVAAGGEGRLEPVDATGLPRLHVRGLALLYAGAADTARLVRLGLLDEPLPGLDAAFAGQSAQILDYF